MLERQNTSLEHRHVIAILVFALSVFGLVIISSASAIIAHRNMGINDYYFWKQFRNLLVGLVMWVIFLNIPYRVYRQISPVIFGVTLFTLVLVFIPGIGNEYGSAKGWIDVPFLPSIQPAEYMKLALIIYLSFILDRMGAKISSLKEGLLPIIFISSMPAILLILQPDFGTTLILAFIVLAMIFVAGADKLHLFGGFILGGLMAVIAASNQQYIYNRFTAFINPFKDNLGTGYHIIQSLIAVGSGGFFGKGFGNSRQKFEYVPEAQGDSIFAIASEELGFFRVVPLILMFTLFAWHGYSIAIKTKDKFGRFLATGITSWLLFQAFINIMVVIAMFPTTGITLPFISYGGSSLIVNLIAVGILMNIGKFEKEEAIIRKSPALAMDSEHGDLYKRKRWK